jgi:hypothetical protein
MTWTTTSLFKRITSKEYQMSITSKVVDITPEMSQELLVMNNANRRINHHVVDMYARDMKAGKWRLTHQGILLGKNHTVIDGQHRLEAIVKAGVTVRMIVFIDAQHESALDVPVDVGYKRGTAAVLGISSTIAACASLAFRMHRSINHYSAGDIAPYVKVIEHPLELLRGGNQNSAKGIANAATQLAGVTRILMGEDATYIHKVYDAMVSSSYSELSRYPIVASFHKQIVVDRVAWNSRQLFARAIRIFDQSRRSIGKLTLKDETLAYEEAKALMVAQVTSRLPAGKASL